jgi:hypothetical protein
MGALTFDTLSVSRVLVEGGLEDEKQATAVTRVIKEAQDAHLEEPATRRTSERNLPRPRVRSSSGSR